MNACYAISDDALVNLRGATEQQTSRMRCSWGFVVSVMLSGSGPLAVVRALLCPLQVGSNNGPQRAAPGHVRVRQQREGAQLSPRLPRK